MKKRGNREGTIYKRKDGRWAASVSLGWDGGVPRRKTFYGKTRQEVAAKLAAGIRDRDLGLPGLPERQSVSQYLSQWLETTRPTIGSATFKRYEEYVRLHASPIIGHHRVSRLAPQHLQRLYARKLGEGLSPTTVNHLHAVLHRALGQALRLSLIGRNPADAVDAPRKARYEIQPLTAEQSRQLLKGARGDRLEALYVLALTTGMRQGELLGLRWRNVDFAQSKVQLRGNLSWARVIAEPKGNKGRLITMTALAVDALRRHRIRQNEERLAMGPTWTDHDLVFTNAIGGYLDANNLRHRAFPKVLERSGVPWIRFHDLRHSTATLLLSLGVHPKVVQELLGHSQISVTLDTYSHVVPDMQREAMAQMNALLAQ